MHIFIIVKIKLFFYFRKEDIQCPMLFATSIRDPSLSKTVETGSTESLFHFVVDQSQISTFPTHFYVFKLVFHWKRIMIFSYQNENNTNINDFEAFKVLSNDDFENGNYPKDLSITLQVFFDINGKKTENPQFDSYVSFPFKEPCKTSKKLLVYFYSREECFPCMFGLLGVSNEENCRTYDVKRLNLLALERVGFEF